MAVIKLKKGYDLNLFGEIKTDRVTFYDGELYAVTPDDFVGLVPRLDVGTGDAVRQGDKLCHDRQFSEIAVTSPVTGVVKEIKRGERRKIESIIIEKNVCDTSFKKFDLRGCAKSLLLESGLWACIQQRPYAVVSNPNVKPRDIFVTAFDSAPLAPDFRVVLKGKEKYIQKGVNILSTLTEGDVYVGVKEGDLYNIKGVTINTFTGPHPAGNVGVQVANVKPVNKGDVVWTLDLVTVARIGEFFTTGKVPYDTVVAVNGSKVENPQYIECTMGIALSSILRANISSTENIKIINGNVLSGYTSTIDGFLRFPYRHVTIIEELSNPGEFMGWASLSLSKFSIYRSFFSWLCSNRRVKLDSKLNGGERAIVMAGEYDRMLPMDIYAEFLIKSIIAFDIEKMEQLGIYEVAPEDFALCEFADTSKLELQRIVREGLDKLRKEME